MDEERRHSRLRSFLIGGLVGAGAGIAAARRRQPKRRRTPVGLAAFEHAPCYEETVRRERTSART